MSSTGNPMDNSKSLYTYSEVRDLLDTQRQSDYETIEKMSATIDQLNIQILEMIENEKESNSNIINEFKEEVKEIMECGETAKGKLFDEILQNLLNV
tara:strand:+ start:186 stop:476 length:291 start_codon:yes stop_codon:yes gene_type:complete